MKRLNYRTIEGYQPQKPKLVDLTSSSTAVYLRRNIEEVPTYDKEGNPTGGTHWRYDEAILTPVEYEDYLADVQSPSVELIMQTLSDMQLQIDEL